ncbi:MAG: hypothetical protein V1827_04945 [Candidatus Micrarchaeota archaeon]
MKPIYALFAVAILAGLSHADIIPDGTVAVSHIAYIDNMDEYPDFAFVVYPTYYGGGARLVPSDGKVPMHYKLVSARIYAVPKIALPENLTDYSPPFGSPSVDAPVSVTYAAVGADTEVETHYKIKLGVGTMELAGADTPDCQTAYWLIVPGIAIGLVGGYLIGKGAGR